jgi:hypothetical protein
MTFTVVENGTDIGDILHVVDLPANSQQGLSRLQNLGQPGPFTHILDFSVQNVFGDGARQSGIGAVDILHITVMVGDEDSVMEGADDRVEQWNLLQGIDIEFQREHAFLGSNKLVSFFRFLQGIRP